MNAGQSRGRAVALSNGVVATALVVLLAVVALVVHPPAPPGIAEFAPQASKPISKAPPGQATQYGTGPGACNEGQTCARPTASAGGRPLPTVSVRRPGIATTVQCYEWPDGSVTQTFDPQSGPCLASWPDAARGNGGATSRGVSATTIRVGWSGNDTYGAEGRAALVRFLNSHFILYGRQIELVKVPPQSYDPSGQAATAAELASKRVFASTEWFFQAVSTATFTQRLVAEHILALSTSSRDDTSAQIAAAAPYRWSFGPAVDHVEAAAAQFICGSLAGHRAEHGGPDVSGPNASQNPRSFALVVEQASGGGTQPVAALRAGLSRCGAPVLERTVSEDDVGNNFYVDPQAKARVSTMLLNLQQAGVTTVVPVADRLGSLNLMQAADQIGYQPEWIWPGVLDQYGDDSGIGTFPSQSAHLMGIAPVNKVLPGTQAMWYLAARAADSGYEGNGGTSLEEFYRQLLMLAVGVQAAGPHLTPATFQAGLQGLDFPNPGAGGPLLYQARVGFGPGSHEMVHDFGIWWFDNTQQPAWANKRSDAGAGGSGGYCWVGPGARWELDHFPRNIRPFAGACR